MKYTIAPAVLALALGALPLAASAQQVAYTAKWVNLRAGPDRIYPVVAQLPPSSQVLVHGCLSDYRWCDVTYGYDRGWVYAGNLRYPYQNGYAPLPSIAPIVGIVILGFVLDDYWGEHYRHRSWYPDRHRYVHPRPGTLPFPYNPPRPQPDHRPRPDDHRPRPDDHRPRPGDHRPRPGDHRPRPGDHARPLPAPNPGVLPAPRGPEGHVRPPAPPQPAPAPQRTTPFPYQGPQVHPAPPPHPAPQPHPAPRAERPDRGDRADRPDRGERPHVERP